MVWRGRTKLRRSIDGSRGLLRDVREAWTNRVYRGGLLTAFSRRPIGTHVLDLDWDVLLLLDSCRVDALRELAGEYDFLGEVGSIRSVGSISPEWIAQTFTADRAEELRRTAYLSNNAHSEWTLVDGKRPEDHCGVDRLPTRWNVVDADRIGHLEHVWKYANFVDEDEWMCTSPEVLTDRLVEFYRERGTEFDRVVAHYEQPHRPYYHAAKRADRPLRDYEKEPWEYLRNGGDERKVWESYLEEARAALDSIELLLENLDAETVAISADHGEAMGEWGVYEHPPASLHPHVKRVPWVETTATDEGTHVPDVDRGESDATVEDHLEALGYLES